MKKIVYYVFLLIGITSFVYTSYAQTVTTINLEISDGIPINGRDTRIRFGNGSNYTKGLNPGYDGGLLATLTEVYTLLVVDDAIPTGISFDVQSLPFSEIGDMTIEVGTILPADTNITFTTSITGDPLPVGHRIILEDRSLGTFTELQGVGDQYTVNVIASDPETGRFYLHTTSDSTNPSGPGTLLAPTSPNNDANADITGSCGADVSDGSVIVTTTPANGFTVNYNSSISLDSSGNFTIADPNWSEGSYQLHFTCTDKVGNGPVNLGPFGPVVIAFTPPAPIVAPDLQSASDTGSLDTDNITSDNTPSFDVVCSEAGNTITLYTDNPSAGTVVGTHTCIGTSIETATVSSSLAHGIHNIAYTDSKLTFESGASLLLNIIVDTIAPSQPALPVLLGSSDSGALGDNITNDDTPSFTVECTEIGSILTPYISGVSNPLFSHTCNTTGTTIITPNFSFPEGPYINLTYTETDVAGNESTASSAVSGEIDLTAPVTPSIAPDLESGSDSGASNSDNITNDDLPDMTVLCTEVGSTITLYSDVPSASTNVGAHTCTTIGAENANITTSLSDGNHNITYSEIDIAGNESGQSQSLQITIDTIAPPGVTINTPTLGAPVTGYTEVGVSVTATSSNGGTCTVNPTIASEISVGAYPGVYICHLSPNAVNKNNISAVATDIAGNSISTTVVAGIKIDGGGTGGGSKSIIYARFPNTLKCLDFFPNDKTGDRESFEDYLRCKNSGIPNNICSSKWATQSGLILCDGSQANQIDSSIENVNQEPKLDETQNNEIMIDGCKHEILYRNKDNRGTGVDESFYSDHMQNKRHPYFDALIDLTEQGIISGRLSGQNNDVRRAELRNFVQRSEVVKLFSIAREDKVKTEKTSNCLKNEFDDTVLHAWYYPYVYNMKKQNIIHGYDDQTFKPAGNITMAETYKITALSFGFITKEEADNISEQDNSQWYKPYKNVLLEKDILSNEIAAKKDDLTITRGEIIYLIAESLKFNDNIE